MKLNVKSKRIIPIISVTAVIVVFIALFISMRKLPKYDFSIDDWKSRYVVYRDGGLGVEDAFKNTGEPLDYLLWGPNKPLKKGSYSVIINYSAEDDQSCYAGASGNDRKFIAATEGILSRHLHTVIYEFELTQDISTFELFFPYSGQGEYIIRSITINANANQLKRTAVEIIFLILLINCLAFFSGMDTGKRQTVFILLGITILTTIPFFADDIHRGDDLEYHLLRIETLLQTIRYGQFPARISPIALYGLGYPFSIYYNDIFLYFPAILRLLGFNVIQAYKIFAFSANLMLVCLSYISFRGISGKRSSGLLMTLLYATASYRLVNVWMRAAVGEYTAQAFLPLIAWAVHRIFSEEKKTAGKWIKDSLLLAAAFSGLIGSHILSFVMTSFIMMLICFVFLKKTFRKQTILTFITAAPITISVMLYFIVPLLDYYFNVPSAMKAGEDIYVSGFIQNEAISVGLLFGFFQKLTGISGNGAAERFQTTPGFPLMIVFVFALYLCTQKKGNGRLKFYLAFSFLTLWLATKAFPWDWLSIHLPFWKNMTNIQFPWRFLAYAVLFLTLIAGEISDQFGNKYLSFLLASVSIVMTFWMTGDYFNRSSIISIHDTSSLNLARVDTHYFLPGSSLQNFEKTLSAQIGTNMRSAEILEHTPKNMLLYCQTDDTAGPHKVAVPIYNYKGYHVADNTGKEYEIINDDLNRIAFLLPDGFEGNITIAFRDPPIWRITVWISAISAFAIILSAAFLLYRSKKVTGTA